MVLAALLSAIGILIPIIMPFKITIEPASFTLASHVPMFIAMYISPVVAIIVNIAASIGFAIAGFPPVVVLRAASQLIFLAMGAMWLKKYPNTVKKIVPSVLFGLVCGAIHGACEAVVSAVFYFGGLLPDANYDRGFFTAVILLVGVGTIVHSMVDYFISLLIWAPLSAMPAVAEISTVGRLSFAKKKAVFSAAAEAAEETADNAAEETAEEATATFENSGNNE